MSVQFLHTMVRVLDLDGLRRYTGATPVARR